MVAMVHHLYSLEQAVGVLVQLVQMQVHHKLVMVV
jgi:hypothetical protein